VSSETSVPAVPIADLAAATPPAALLQEDMAFAAHFRRDHYPAPAVDPRSWSLVVEGAVRRPLCLGLPGLRALARARTQRVTLECAGHRRTEHDPPAPGLAWEVGAVGEARWTGVPLAAVLELAGLERSGHCVVLEGADRGPFAGRAGEHAFARALPLAKALAPETVLSWEVNGEPLPVDRGGPVRAVVPGWYATDSVKWLTRVTVLEGEFDGPWETEDYRIIRHGEEGPGERMHAMPVHALLVDTRPAEGQVALRGIAWGGEDGVCRVDVRLDGGPWRPGALGPDRGPYARRFWCATRRAAPGRRCIEVRAVDRAGITQPLEVPANVCGYANNAVHRVMLEIAG
jgi:DMSO/TMAO reductase YedYZ molybdopterin-dependent catalytic subunit